MVSKLIVGVEPWLSLAVAHWSETIPGIIISKYEITFDREYKYNVDSLGSYSPTEITGFVAWGNDFLNFQRWEIFGELKRRGFKMPSLIHPSVVGANQNSVGENCWIMPHVVMAPDVRIGLNSTIGTSTIIFPQTTIKNNVWIGTRCSIGFNCEINSHSIIGDMVNIDSDINIGKFAVREIACTLNANAEERSFSFRKENMTGLIIDYGGKD